jgi:probable HAF family extracellular repeat protein
MRQHRTLPAALCVIAGTLPMTAQSSPEHGKQHIRYVLVDLGTFGGPTSSLNCCGNVPPVLNNRGTVTGSADTSKPNPNFTNFNPCIPPDPFLSLLFKWQNGSLTSLKPLPGGFNTTNGSINTHDAISGNSEVGEMDPILGVPGCHAALWEKDSVVDLGTLEGGYESLAFAINDNNLVVGAAANTIPDPFSTFLFGWSTETRAFVWQNGVMRDLGTLGGNDAAANYVNDEGQIIGSSFTDTMANPTTGLPTQHPFLWEDGRMIDLGSLGGSYGFPSGINNHGSIAGLSYLAGDTIFHPFLWDRGVISDLGTLGGDSGYALGINDAGEVVGRADLPGSAYTTLSSGSTAKCLISEFLREAGRAVPHIQLIPWARS